MFLRHYYRRVMEKIDSFEETLMYLKDKAVITSDGRNLFYLSNGHVVNKFNGNSVKMKKEDFIELYKDETFYLKEDNSIFIDDEKDEDYYRYYKK